MSVHTLVPEKMPDTWASSGNVHTSAGKAFTTAQRAGRGHSLAMPQPKLNKDNNNDEPATEGDIGKETGVAPTAAAAAAAGSVPKAPTAPIVPKAPEPPKPASAVAMAPIAPIAPIAPAPIPTSVPAPKAPEAPKPPGNDKDDEINKIMNEIKKDDKSTGNAGGGSGGGGSMAPPSMPRPSGKHLDMPIGIENETNLPRDATSSVGGTKDSNQQKHSKNEQSAELIQAAGHTTKGKLRKCNV